MMIGIGTPSSQSRVERMGFSEMRSPRLGNSTGRRNSRPARARVGAPAQPR